MSRGEIEKAEDRHLQLFSWTSFLVKRGGSKKPEAVPPASILVAMFWLSF
jgi:hypothetical protein